uniref:G protein-regulated inducer of neurite outgrowth C-terminal domain-containing protein n=1 Tax=Latimeria chalumnae TaxID=7897 RepID=H3A3Y0_LATCH
DLSSFFREMVRASPAGKAQADIKTSNHFVNKDRSPSTLESDDEVRVHVITNIAENHSPVTNIQTVLNKEHSVGRLDVIGTMGQRSCSDIIYGNKENKYQSTINRSGTSAAYAVMDSCNNNESNTSSEVCFQGLHSGLARNATVRIDQNNVAEIMNSTGTQHVNTPSYGNGSMQHNIMICIGPGSVQQNPPGTIDSSTGYPNSVITKDQVTGVTACSSTAYNVTCVMPSQIIMTNHINSPVHSNVMQEPSVRMNDTIPAYCHSLPIPAVHLFPRLVNSVSESGREQIAPASGIITFPKLVSSVSESGLDAKRILKCYDVAEDASCQLEKESMFHVISSGNQMDMNRAPQTTVNSQSSLNLNTKMKDTWTMTSVTDLTMVSHNRLEQKDAEVQTVPLVEFNSVAASSRSPPEGFLVHVFPEVSLEVDESCPKSPVREVSWDDEGMTWEVYGASVDPEVLGLAIQKHLEIQIEQQQLGPSKLSRQTTEDQPTTQEKRRSFRNIIQTLRHPTCCVRSSTAGD